MVLALLQQCIHPVVAYLPLSLLDGLWIIQHFFLLAVLYIEICHLYGTSFVKLQQVENLVLVPQLIDLIKPEKPPGHKFLAWLLYVNYSFILSHPLYFLYFVFFIATSLLLGLGNSAPKLSEPGASFLLSTIFHAITHRLLHKVEYEIQEFHTNLEEYRIVFLFHTSIFDATENPVEVYCLQAFDNLNVANLEGKTRWWSYSSWEY